TPVSIGGGGLPSLPGRDEGEEGREPDKESDDGAGKRKPGNPTEAKAVNDAVAYIRSLAEMRGRNADWAESAVREAQSLSATAALERGVVDIVATGIDDLLKKTHGREVRLGERVVVLDTAGLAVQVFDPDWRTKLLG